MDTVKVNPQMPEMNRCPQCGTPLPSGALAGLCPACLLKEGAEADTATGGQKPGFTPPSVAELAPLFPQLEILELIGKGGMGAVYKARQKQLDRVVALKILPPGVGNDPAFAERFTREAKALARLNHPGIVTLYEFGVAEGRAGSPLPAAGEPLDQGRAAECVPCPPPRLYYVLMEFVDGVNLRQLLHASRVSPREALAIVPQICDALQYAHDLGIVHRDIKPENILLDRRGRVKVADFGLAKIVAGRDASPTRPGDDQRPAGPAIPANLTEAGKVMGTPQYMSPEQVQAPGSVDHRADIYALGVVFYQMLTGELPGKPLAPPSSKVQMDVRLDAVVLRALEVKPELRYEQASILKTQVETIAASSPGGEGLPDRESAAEGLMRPEAQELGRELRQGFGRGPLVWLAQQCLFLFDLSAPVPGFVEREGKRRLNFWPLLLLFCSTIGFGVNSLVLAFSVAQRIHHGIAPQDGGVVFTAQETNFLIWAILGAVGRLAALNLGQAAAEITRRRVIRACLWVIACAAMVPANQFFTDILGSTSSAQLLKTAGLAKSLGLSVLAVAVFYVVSIVFRAVCGASKSVRQSMEASATSKGLPAAEAWLAVLDSGNYAQSWETAYFLRTLGKEEWVSRLERTRRPLGRALSRKLTATKVTAGKRRCEAKFTFATSFEKLPAATETATFALQPGLDWKAIGYLVHPAGAPADGPATDGQGLSLSEERKFPGHLERQRLVAQALSVGAAADTGASPLVTGSGNQRLSRWVYSVAAVATLLLLTASGNAFVMLLGSAIILVIGLFVVSKRAMRTALLVGLAAVGVAAIAVVLLQSKPRPVTPAEGAAWTNYIRLKQILALGARGVGSYGDDEFRYEVQADEASAALTVSYRKQRDRQYRVQVEDKYGRTRALEEGGLVRTSQVGDGYDMVQEKMMLSRKEFDRVGAFVLQTHVAQPDDSLLVFGPVRECSLPMSALGYSYCLNLDTGVMQTMPASLTQADWGTAITLPEGIIVVHPPTEQAIKVAGVGTQVRPLLEAVSTWENPRSGDLHVPDEAVSGQTATVTRERHAPPLTFAFKTAKGTRGLLQITGFSNDPREVKVRYKLVQPAVKPTALKPLAPKAAERVAIPATNLPPLQFRLVAAAGDTNSAADDLADPADPTGHRHVRVLSRVLLDGSAIARAGYELPYGYNNQNGTTLLAEGKSPPDLQRCIELDLTLAGGRAWEEITATNLERQIAIVFRGRVLSLPVIRSRLPSGHITIKGPMRADLVREVVAALNAGPTGKPQAWRFSEPTEVTLSCRPGWHSGVDLATGRCLTNSNPDPPLTREDPFAINRALREWMLANGLDLTGLSANPTSFQLVTCGVATSPLYVHGGSEAAFLTASTNAYSITAGDVVYNWTLMTQDEQKTGVVFGLLLTNQSNVHLFRTRKGCLGILEVLKADTKTPQVRVRYKRVQMAKANDPTPMPSFGDAANRPPFVARLGQGEIELVALSRHPSADQPWWRPDGTPWTNGVFENPNRHTSDTKGKRFEFVIQRRELPQDTSLEYSFEPGALEVSWADQPRRQGKVLTDCNMAVALLPESAEEVTLRLGVAAGEWKTMITRTPASGGGGSFQLGSHTCRALFLDPSESGGESRVAVSYNKVPGWAVRVTALDIRGQSA